MSLSIVITAAVESLSARSDTGISSGSVFVDSLENGSHSPDSSHVDSSGLYLDMVNNVMEILDSGICLQECCSFFLFLSF